jgi:hypothetical protein
VTVTSYESSTGDPRPADGASISYEGHTTTTDSEGHASLTLEGGGPAYLYVTAPNSIRAFTHLCVYLPGETCNADGTISGTPTGGGKASGGVDGYTSTGPGSGPGPAPLSGPDAITAALSSVRGGHTYSRSRAPRVLAGHVHASLALRSVSLMLRRSYHGRCYAYAGSSERFVRARCGHGAFFQVATGPSFSYLLPTRLPAGHYVLELEAIDLAGNRTALAKGSTEVSFDVR